MIVGVDVGYGYTKAMAENGESLVFPSVVGTGFERKLDKLMPSGASEADNYDLIINGDEPQHYFVGNLAILHSHDAARPFSDNRSNAEEIKPALLTTVARLSKGDNCTLVTGLPLEPYLKQAKMLKNSLEKLSGIEVILNSEKAKIVFDRVIMFPQAVAAIYGQLKRNCLGSNGLVGLVDMGYRTTDMILYDLAYRKILDEYRDTVTCGMNDVVVGIRNEIKSETGDAPNLEWIEQSLIQQKPLYFNRKEYDVIDMAAKQEKALRNLVLSHIARLWRDQMKKLKLVYLAGGGAFMLQSGISQFANCEVVQNAQMANAYGYLLKGLSEQENLQTSATT
ncbi:MAG TPA: ParM/StbA family protein [Bacillota bacterium]|nr:ParM/StbA family protein [Bacillota bacterium]